MIMKQLLLFVMMLLPMAASANGNGACGTDISYTHNSSTGILTISGFGTTRSGDRLIFLPKESKTSPLLEMHVIEGDVDGDGEVNEDDIAEVEKVILDPSVGYDPDKDVNHDGKVNVADIVTIVNIIKKNTDAGSDPNPNPTPSVESNPIISIGVCITNNSSSAVTLDGYLRFVLGNPDHNGYYFGGWEGFYYITGDIRFSNSPVTLAPGATIMYFNLSWKDEYTGCGLGETSPLSPKYLPIYKEDGSTAYARNVLLYIGGRSDLILCDNLSENIVFKGGGMYSIVIR